MLDPTRVPNLCQRISKKFSPVSDPARKYPFEAPTLKRPGPAAQDQDWHVEFRIWSQRKNQLHRVRLRVSDATITQRKETAKHLMKEINLILEEGAYIDPAENIEKNPDFPFVVALDKWMDSKRMELKKQSVTTYEKWGRYVMGFVQDKKLTHIGIRDFDIEMANRFKKHMKQEKGLSNKTFNACKGYLSTFFNENKKLYGLSDNPMSTLKTLKTTSSKHRAYNPAQIALYKEKCYELHHEALWFFARFIYYTFMRPNFEARLVQIGDIKTETIVIYSDNSKTDLRHVMIPAPLEEIFQQRNIRKYPPHYYLFGHDDEPGPIPVGRSWFYKRHLDVMEAMDLKNTGYDIYGWKHTGVIALYQHTKDLMLVRDQCGHKHIEQTVQYLRDLGLIHKAAAIHHFPKI